MFWWPLLFHCLMILNSLLHWGYLCCSNCTGLSCTLPISSLCPFVRQFPSLSWMMLKTPGFVRSLTIWNIFFFRFLYQNVLNFWILFLNPGFFGFFQALPDIFFFLTISSYAPTGVYIFFKSLMLHIWIIFICNPWLDFFYMSLQGCLLLSQSVIELIHQCFPHCFLLLTVE